MSEDNGLHRLEGSNDQKGGLILKKKPPTFKIPQPSLLGLDKLAATKRKELEAARKMSFSTEDEAQDDANFKHKSLTEGRKFRQSHPETPTYTGGITEEAKQRILHRLNANKRKEKGVYASTKDFKRKHEIKDDHVRKRHERRYESRSLRHHNESPRFKDEPRTPNLKVKDITSKSSWDDDDAALPKKSSWDFPTPNIHKSGGDWSERSSKSRHGEDKMDKRSEFGGSSHRNLKRHKYESDTPRATPAHKFNQWARDRRKTGATPGYINEQQKRLKWDSTVDRQLWEEEQRRIDREWYNMDEGECFIT